MAFVTQPVLITDIGGQGYRNRGPVYYPKPSATLTLEIVNGDSFTNVFEFVGYKYFGIQLPAVMDGTAFRVYGLIEEPTVIGDMREVHNGAGGLIEFEFAQDTMCSPSPAVFYGLSAVRYIALETRATVGGLVQNQGDDRSFTAMLMG